MSVNYRYTTPCGHEATVKLCLSVSGPNAGKWVVKIKGPKVKLKSGVKTFYCARNEEAAKGKIAKFLFINSSSIVKTENPSVNKTNDAKVNVQVTSSTVATTSSTKLNTPSSVAVVQKEETKMKVEAANTASAACAASMQHAVHTTTASQSCPNDNTVAVVINNNGLIPTEAQERIYKHAKPPFPIDTNFTVRITAGAGAGKTTTVLQVAARAAQLGHNHITYLTFSRAAAADGAKRIQEALQGYPNPPIIDARTLHSSAMKLLSNERNEEFQEDDTNNGKLTDDEALQAFIVTTISQEIDDFLSHAKKEITTRANGDERKIASMMEAAEHQVCFFIFKTISQFCRSPNTLEQFKDPMTKNRVYYPADIFHKPGETGEKFGFPSEVYRFKVGKYADMAVQVWEAATAQNIRSYDIEMKRAQLKALRIPGSVLLVDESQDMDGCQVDWIVKQRQHGTHIYIVGDAAQTIYSFRGAKSKYMVNIKETTDFKLTKSWRFGPNIASVANIVLFSKQMSAQTQPDNASWKPYRVEGGGRAGIVTTDSILGKWREMPITVIAAFNATLLHTAASMLGMDVSSGYAECEFGEEMQEDTFTAPSENQESTLPIVTPSPALQNTNSQASGAASLIDGSLPISFPKIHINGHGENSGLKKWRSVLKQIQHIYNLYKSGDEGYVLPAKTFKEFNGATVTWDLFCDQVVSREMTKYASSMHVVKTFGDQTNQVMELFEREVMDKKYSADEADVILSTTHAAKGMEWDNVHVCDDFADLFQVSCDGPVTAKRKIAGSNMPRRTSWQFHIKSWGDDVNLLYVACTRAKKLLCIPAKLKKFLQDCDMLHIMIRSKKLYKEQDMKKSSEIVVFGRNSPFTIEEVLDLYQDVVLPLRRENQLETKQLLMKALVKPLDGSQADFEDEKEVEGDDEFTQFFSGGAASSNATEPDGGSATKKQKISRAADIIKDAKQAAATAPSGVFRPYDKIDTAAKVARCRECDKEIAVGSYRVGVQVYKPEHRAYWCSYFHAKCFPRELKSKLRLDPNPNRKKAASGKKSWNGKKRYNGGYKKYNSWGGGWKKRRW